MPIITLTTDFGTKDPDLGYLKSQILKQIPQATLVDISHQVLPFDPDEAIYIIQNALQDFPEGSIHLIGIDSMSYQTQKPILVQSNGQYFLGHDNGLITTALKNKQIKVYRLPYNRPESFMQVQIEAAKWLSQGQQPTDFASETNDYKQFNLSKPLVKYHETTGAVNLIVPKVIYTDHYGNAIFNLTKEDFEQWQNKRAFKIKVSHYEIDNIIEHYSDVLSAQEQMLAIEGHMFARFNRFEHFEIFIYKSNHISGGADTLLGLQKNQTVHIVFE